MGTVIVKYSMMLAIILGLPVSDAKACSTFSLGNTQNPIVAKSYDWHTAVGLALTNPRGLGKQALVLPTQKSATKPLQWVAKYGSLTFNQYGREFPNSGINEKGLVVEIMILEASEYPPDSDKRPLLNELQWIQYQLDNFATVQEVVANVRKIRVNAVYAKVHYLVCDKTGDCGSFEYIGGKMVVNQGKEFAMRALANSTYAESNAYAKRFKTFGGSSKKKFQSDNSLDRFARAAQSVQEYSEKENPVDYAFESLNKVRVKRSQWQVVYELGAGKAHFRFAGEQQSTSFAMANLDFSCKAQVQAMDLNGDVNGKKRQFTTYTAGLNYKLIQKSLGELEKQLFDKNSMRQLAGYPDMSRRCAKKGT